MTMNLSAVMQQALEHQNEDQFQLVLAKARQWHEHIGETLRTLTKEEIAQLIMKLKHGETLKTDDIQLLRQCVIGDALSYLHSNRSLEQQMELYWEFETEIAEYEAQALTPAQLQQLQGLLVNLEQLTTDIIHYYNCQERVAHFEASVQAGIGRLEGEIFIDLLTEQIKSPDDRLKEDLRRQTQRFQGRDNEAE